LSIILHVRLLLTILAVIVVIEPRHISHAIFNAAYYVKPLTVRILCCRCTLCQASYPTPQGLQMHRQMVHKETGPPPPSPNDMGIPVVDLRTPGTVERLSRLGIHHYIPLPMQNSGGFFSIPIVSADMARNPAMFSLQAMNATSVMPFGPLRALPR
jgi:hypothetical protein